MQRQQQPYSCGRCQENKGMENNIIKWLWMLIVFGTGSSFAPEIALKYSSVDEAYEKLSDSSCLEDEMKRNGFEFSKPVCRRICTTPLSQCEMIYNYCCEKNIGIISYDSEYYPESLKNGENPPCILFYRGDPSIFKMNTAVSVVGTRKPAEYSMRVAEKICSDLAKDGFVIVSGFANGIDRAAHEAALAAGGRTIAVIGCGIDVEYPRKSDDFKKKMAESGGIIISEYLPGTLPRPAYFPKRNRIIAALGLGTLVIQAPMQSGALITASLALELGKNVFCIPPADIFSESYSGVIKFLRDGAIPVFSHLDIVNAYYFSNAHNLNASHIFPVTESERNTEFSSIFESEYNGNEKGNDKSSTDISDKNGSDISDEKNNKTKEKKPEFEDDNQRKIAELLRGEGPLHIDVIAAKTELEMAQVLTSLTELEVMGYARQMPGKIYESLEAVK